MTLQLAKRINGPLVVIGDVHGQTNKLITVLDKIRELPDYEQRWLVFIGDFVDRGPDPKGTLDIFLELLAEHPRTTAICGNHELAMAGALNLFDAPDYANWGEQWVDLYDSETTFASYGAPIGDLNALRSSMPAAHLELLSDLPWVVEHPKYLFVHAGLDANAPFEMQLRILQSRDFTLNRPKWICSKSLVDSDGPPDCPVPIVSGHVCVPQVSISRRRILVDTTGGMGGDLSAVVLPENRVLTSGNDYEAAQTDKPKSWWRLFSRAS